MMTGQLIFFRKHSLIWSAIFPPDGRLEALDHTWFDELNMGMRRIIDGTHMLRLFYLSLLWRAAETTLYEFENVSLPPGDLEKLREMVLNGNIEPFDFYPITLTQLITIGFPHIWSAFRSKKSIPQIGNNNGFREVSIFRFYFDGLVAHIHIDDDPMIVRQQESFFVSQANELLVTTLLAQDSWQMNAFWEHVHSVERL